MPTPSINQLHPVNSLGPEFNTEPDTIDTPPILVYPSLNPAIMESYNPFHSYNGELHTRSITPAALPPFRQPTPVENPSQAKDSPHNDLPGSFPHTNSSSEWMADNRTRGQWGAMLRQLPSQSIECALETPATPRKRPATIIDVDELLYQTDKNYDDSDSLSEIHSVSEPDGQYIDDKIDPRYDPSVLKFRDRTYWVPRTCQRSFLLQIWD
jgi:hypothetical protein